MKKKVIVVIVLLMIGLVFINWFYPFSYFSFSQSTTYKPDEGLVQEYKESLELLENISTSDSTSKFIENQTYLILDTFNRKLFLDVNGTKIERMELEGFLMGVQDVRMMLVDLAFQEEYSKLDDEYLKSAIEIAINIEHDIMYLMSDRFFSKKEIGNLLNNLHVQFRSLLNMYHSLYEEYQLQ